MLNGAVDSAIGEQLTRELAAVVPRIIELLSLNWDHPYRPIQSLARPLFDSCIQLSIKLHGGVIDWTSTVDSLIGTASRSMDRGSYQMLTALLAHCDAMFIIECHREFIGASFRATRSIAVWGLVCSFIEKLLISVKARMPIDDFRELFLPPVTQCLLSDAEQVRIAVSGSFLPSLLTEIDPQSFLSLVNAIRLSQLRRTSLPDSDDWYESLDVAHLRAFVTVLAVARRSGRINTAQFERLLQGNHSLISKEAGITVKKSLIVNCLIHSDSSVRMEALEFLCSNRFTSELPCLTEFGLFVSCYPFLIRVADPAIRTRVLKSALHRFLVRIRDSAAKIIREEANKQFGRVATVSAHSLIRAVSIESQLKASFRFVAWFSSFAISSAYPAAPFDRKVAACEVFV